MTDRQFVLATAKSLGTEVVYDVPAGGDASPYSLPFRTPPVIHLYDDKRLTGEGYWVALHELGHVADHPGPIDPIQQAIGASPKTIEDEARAWLWALDTTYRPLDDTGRDIIATAVGGYLSITGLPPEASYAPALTKLVRRVQQPSYHSAGAEMFNSMAPAASIARAKQTWNDAVALLAAAA